MHTDLQRIPDNSLGKSVSLRNKIWQFATWHPGSNPKKYVVRYSTSRLSTILKHSTSLPHVNTRRPKRGSGQGDEISGGEKGSNYTEEAPTSRQAGRQTGYKKNNDQATKSSHRGQGNDLVSVCDMEGDIRTPELWYKSLPTLTRAILTLTFFSSLLGTVGLFNPSIIILDWTLVINKFHLWRLITDYFFAGQFGITWLMHIYFFVTFSSKLEVNEMFTVSPGAYLFFLLFQMISLDLLSLILFWPYGKPIMAQALVMSIIYYWSRREPYSQIGLWGFTVQAYQFPFALIFLDLILGHSLLIGLMGLLTGHFFYFLKDVLPVEKGIDVLQKAPAACDELMLRFSRFEFTNLSGSLKILLYGVPPVSQTSHGSFFRAPPSRFGTVAGSTSSARDESRQLFTGEGRRLAD